MRYLPLVIFFAVHLWANAQNDSAAIAKAGVLSYSILRANQSTQKPKLKQYLDANFRMAVGSTDSVLNESFTTNKPMALMVDHPSFKHIFLQLYKGDRVQIMISADSFYKYTSRQAMPDRIKKGDSLSFFIKVLDIMDDEGLMKKQMKEDEEKIELDSFYINEYLNRLNNVKATPRGLNYVVTRPGTGIKPEAGDSVVINYRGYFFDGRVFDKTTSEGYSFILGIGQVIAGLDEGVALMNQGAKFKLVIPYFLAYGSNGNALVPPFSSLIFDVELIAVKPSTLKH